MFPSVQKLLPKESTVIPSSSINSVPSISPRLIIISCCSNIIILLTKFINSVFPISSPANPLK